MSAPVPPGLPDTYVAPLLLELRECWRAELARTLSGRVCRCWVHWGATAPVMDGCHCNCDGGNGDGWVRLVELSADPGTGSFTEGRNRFGNAGCVPGVIATVAIGSYRCIPMSEDGSRLPEATENSIGLLQQSELMAFLRLLNCCPAWTDEETRDRLRIGSAALHRYQPIRVADCAGGEGQIRVVMQGLVKCGDG